MMMKRLFYIFTCVLLLASCSDEISTPGGKSKVKEGDEATLTFSINMPEEQILETRALGEMTDALQRNLNLYLMVFDENGILVQVAKATPGANVQHNGHTDTEFTVTLNATSSERIIHFIAYDGTDGTGIGAQINNLANQFGTESSMVAQQLYTQGGQAAYWHRLTVDEIKADDPETSEDESTKFPCVPLVRNFSKISFTNSATGFTISGYTIVNAPSRGSVAPYYGGEFIEFAKTPNAWVNKTYAELETYPGIAPSGTTYSTSTTFQTGNLYLYETPNAAGDDKGRTSVIIKGHLGNAADSYYKVDLIYNDDTHEERGHIFYNILRNFDFQVTIKSVTGSGYSSLEAAIAGAANNNLSASTATQSLSHISDGVQLLEVTNIYYCYTNGGVKQELKYRFLYNDNGTWRTNNDLAGVSPTNTALFNGGDNGWSVATADDTTGDYVGWRTITMDLVNPTAQSQNTVFHIYASPTKINASNLTQALKTSLTSGEQLYRDVRIDLRYPYTMLLDCPSYVPSGIGQTFTAYLLIPQSIDPALFPLDFYLEAQDKYVNPNAASSVKLPVHVGPTIVNTSGESSFQYTRTVTKAEFEAATTRTVNGVTYKVVPCDLKTTVAQSATTLYAANRYFQTASDNYLNVPVAFTDNTELTIDFDHAAYFGRDWPVTITFSVTAEAAQANTPFTITFTEGSETTTVTVTPGAGEYTYTGYQTKTMNSNSIGVTVTAQMTGREQESKNVQLTLNRRYFIIKANSFTTNIASFLDEGQTGDGASIFVNGTYVGWFGNTSGSVTPGEGGYLTNAGPLADYIIDRAYQNYATLEDNMPVQFQIYGTNFKANTTIKDLDDARRGANTSLYVEFSEQP